MTASVRDLQFSRNKRLAKVWKITRTDGTIFRFTSHDVQLVVLGETYTPNAAPNPSARRREAGIKEHDLDFRGVISSTAITSADLIAGRFDDAQIDERLVDWRFPWAGVFAFSRYWVTKIVYDGEKFHAGITGLARWLRPRFGDVYGRTCRFNLGDANCGVAVPSVASVVVEGTMDGEGKRIIRATTASLSAGYADGYFAFGKVVFTSGANNGLTGEVKGYVSSTRQITLQLSMPFVVAAGDTFTIYAGCPKTTTGCKSFSNIARFGGFPFIPTTDRVLRVTPRR